MTLDRGDGTAEIRLNAGQIAIIDSGDIELVFPFRWFAQWSKRGKCFYVCAAHPETRKWTALHRVVMNAPDGMDVDHRDWNTLNNRRENLRICTNLENKSAERRDPRKKGGVKLMTDRRRRKPWRATWNNKHISTHVTEAEARAVINKRREQEFASLAALAVLTP